MKISNIVLLCVQGQGPGSSFARGDRQAKALDIYPEFNQPGPADWQGELNRPMQAIYVQIETDEKVSGIFGPINKSQAFIIHDSLSFLAGRDPLAIELLHDQMMRLNRHGRSGLFVTAVSAIDCALYDLKGKAWGQPVYRLLGGPTRPEVPAYASMLGFSVEPDAAAQTARAYKEKGFQAQKWFFRFGPGDGELGAERNLAMARAVREAVGPYYVLMFDAFMGWSLGYATQMVKALASLNPTWMEEPVPPERVGTLRRIRAAAAVPLATGEHVYTRWQAKELLVEDAVDVLQTDPDWTGGITEQVKICALASAFGVPVVAHGHSLLPALHVAGAQSPETVPWVEFLIQSQERHQYFHAPIYRPVGGFVRLPDLPGLGLVLDESKIEVRKALYA